MKAWRAVATLLWETLARSVIGLLRTAPNGGVCSKTPVCGQPSSGSFDLLESGICEADGEWGFWAALARADGVMGGLVGGKFPGSGLPASKVRDQVSHPLRRDEGRSSNRNRQLSPSVNTIRLLGSYRVSVSALAKMHSPRSANFRWVKAWGSRASRRPAPGLACRYTP
jgi:hypothetical protein